KVASARLDQLTAQIERQQSTLDGDLANLSYTKIYAPMSGTIVSQSAVVGQTLNANQTTPTILRIADLSVMTVEADVSEADVLRVKPGAEAYFTTLGDMAQKWRTNVRQVLPQPEVLNDVVLYKVLLDVQNTEETLKPEMTAQVFFVTGSAKDAVLAPVAALRESSGSGRRGTRERGETRERAGEIAQASSAESGEPRGGRAATREDAGLMAARASDGGRRRGEQVVAFAGLREAREKFPEAQAKSVLVMNKGKPEMRTVLVGLQSRADAEILFGLEQGDVVVTGETAGAAGQTAQTQSQQQRPPGFGRRRP
ncbi:MAG: efflux RND transporter periplasmic adaptor subunit, partial [Parvularculaceae bacterium]